MRIAASGWLWNGEKDGIVGGTVVRPEEAYHGPCLDCVGYYAWYGFEPSTNQMARDGIGPADRRKRARRGGKNGNNAQGNGGEPAVQRGDTVRGHGVCVGNGGAGRLGEGAG